MVFFGHRHQSRDETALARKARNPYAPSLSPPQNRNRRQEVDADGDLDALCEQEIQRYEELFDSNNRGFAGPGDDDTLQDGSIYTSAQTLQGPPSIMRPPNYRNSSPAPSFEDPEDEPPSLGDPDDETLWGLQDPYKLTVKPVPTSLLSPKEQAAAARLAGLKGKKKTVEARNPPTSKTPVDSKSKGSDRTEFKKQSDSAATPLAKKDKKKAVFSPKRLFRGSNKAAASSKLPPSSSSRQQAANFKTPETRASTPSPAVKKGFFSPRKFFQRNPSQKDVKKQHPNLLLASITASSNNKKDVMEPPSPSMNVKCNSPAFIPPRSPSPPPPIDQFDVCSVSSAQSGLSALTDALDAWMISNSPPKIVGGDHLQKCSPNRLEAYGGGLSLYRTNGDDESYDDDDDDDEEEEEGDENYASSSRAAQLSEEGLYYHNTHKDNQKRELSPASMNDESSLFRAIKEQRGKRVQQTSASLLHRAATASEDESDMHVVKILGLKDDDEVRSAEISVKRNLFGNGRLEKDAHSEPSVRASMVKEHESNTDGNFAAAVSAQKPSKQLRPPIFRKFLTKMVHGGEKQAPQQQQEKAAQQWSEQEKGRVRESVKKIESTLELKQQDKNTRSFSLMAGNMKGRPIGSSTSFTESSHPTSSNTGSRPTTPTVAPTLCMHCQINDRTHIVLPCMHYTLCDECVEQARGISTDCHCHTCKEVGFLYARVGVLEGQELQGKLSKVTPVKKKAEKTLQALAFQ